MAAMLSRPQCVNLIFAYIMVGYISGIKAIMRWRLYQCNNLPEYAYSSFANFKKQSMTTTHIHCTYLICIS